MSTFRAARLLAGLRLAVCSLLVTLGCGGDDGNTPPPDAGSEPDASVEPDAGIVDPPRPFTIRANGAVYALHQAQGAYFLGGDFTAVNGTMIPNFGILGTDGSVAATCDFAAGFDGEVRAIVRSGGSLFVGGQFRHYQGQAIAALAKLDATTCALDTTFSQPGNGLAGGGPWVHALVLANGALYVGGYFTDYRGVANAAMSLAKLDPTTGNLDTTFSPVGATANGVGAGNIVSTLAASSTSLYLGGFFQSYRGVSGSAKFIAKVDLTTGVLDATFSPLASNGFDGFVAALAVDGTSLYAGGSFTAYRGAGNSALRLAKLDAATGALDTTFTKPASGMDNSVLALAVQGASLYVGGSFNAYRGVANSARSIAKLDRASGNLDTAFSPVGANANGFDDNASVRALALLGSSLYVGGNFAQYRGASAPSLAKLDVATGAMDTTFHPSGDTARGFSTNDTVWAIDVVAGSLAVGGYLSHYAGTAAGGIAKIDATTFVADPTFAGNGVGFDSTVTSITSIGNALYVGGSFNSYQGVVSSARRLAKLDATTGAIDTTFSPAGASSNGFDSAVASLATDGTALFVGGYFTAYRGVVRSANCVAKLDATTGAIDTTFSPVGVTANGFDDGVTSLAYANGTLYVGGAFTAYKGVASSANRLAKLDATSGAIDTTFSPVGATANGTDDDIDGIAIVGNGLVISGSFSTYRGTAVQGLAKVGLTTGALDTAFTMTGANNGASGSFYGMAVSGTSLYAVGDTGTYRGAPTGGIVKLDATTGVLDTAFTPGGDGFDNSPTSIVVSGSDVVVAGYFASYRGARALNIVRLDGATGTAH